MSQSLSHILIHLVWSTKDRRLFLQNESHRTALYQNLCNISAKLDCPILTVGGIADHVHLLGRMSRTISVEDWVKELKRVSSVTAKELAGDLASFSWQAGYGAFSVSKSQELRVAKYVDNQEKHHRKATFQDEFRILCKQHEIEIDEQYVWD